MRNLFTPVCDEHFQPLINETRGEGFSYQVRQPPRERPCYRSDCPHFAAWEVRVIRTRFVALGDPA